MKFRELFNANSAWRAKTILTITDVHKTDECEAIEAVAKYGDREVLFFNGELVVLVSS